MFLFRPSTFHDREVIDLATGSEVGEVGFDEDLTEVVVVGKDDGSVGFAGDIEGFSARLEC